jgi:iron complex outermembrane receptor protein
MWGANAVNGVINVITKEATDTEGGMLALGLGDEERGYAAFRGSGVLGDDAHYRVYGRLLARDNFEDRAGNPGADSWETVHGGFRLDWVPRSADRVSLQGTVYRGNVGERAVFPTLEAPYTITREGGQFTAGGHLLSLWNRQHDNGSELTVQSYFDRTVRDSDRILRDAKSTFDLDVMHRFFLGGRQDVSWGFGYRSTWDDLQGSSSISFIPDERADHLFSSFVHDKITLKENQTYISFGSKFEHNSYTGFEVQPSARGWWKLGVSRSLWAAVSRAVRTPSRAEADIRVPQDVLPPGTVGLPDPVVLAVIGNDDFESEDLLAYEAGYRSRPLSWLSLDIVGFYNSYKKLRTLEPGPMILDNWGGEDALTIPFTAENNMRGETRGVETVAEFRVSDQWRITGVYSYLDISLELVNGSLDPLSLEAEEQSPRHQLAFRSSMDITRTVALDVGLRHVGEVPAAAVDAYTVMDFRIGWEASPGLDLGLVGRNLLKDHHAEFQSSIINTVPTQVQPSIFGTLAWHFE